MVCPSCGTAVEVPGKFCATCGAVLPEMPVSEATNQEAAAPSNVEPAAAAEAPPAAPAPPVAPPMAPPAATAPPAWTQQPPAQPAPPLWTQPGPTAPAQPAPAPYPAQQPPAQPAPAPYPAQQPYAAPQYAAPQYGAPQAPGYGAPQYGAPGYAVAQPRAVAPARGGAAMIGGLLAVAGGALAAGSALLPWVATKTGDTLIKPIDVPFSASELANGYYLIGAGALAAVCGLLLLIGIARTSSLRMILALGAIAGGVGVLAVEYVAYGHVNDTVNAFGSFAAIGMGLYLGAGGGVAAILGGVAGLSPSR